MFSPMAAIAPSNSPLFYRVRPLSLSLSGKFWERLFAPLYSSTSPQKSIERILKNRVFGHERKHSACLRLHETVSNLVPNTIHGARIIAQKYGVAIARLTNLFEHFEELSKYY